MNEDSKLGSYWKTPSGGVYQLLMICRDSKGGLIFVAERCTETGESFYNGEATAIGLWQGQAHDLESFTPAPKLRPGLVLADKDDHVQAFLLERTRGNDMLWRLRDGSLWSSREGWEARGYTKFRQATKVYGEDFDITVN